MSCYPPAVKRQKSMCMCALSKSSQRWDTQKQESGSLPPSWSSVFFFFCDNFLLLMITYFPLIFLWSRQGTDYQGSKILVTSSGCWGFSEALEVSASALGISAGCAQNRDRNEPTDSHSLNLETSPSSSRTILLEFLWLVQQSKQSCPTFLVIPSTCDDLETSKTGDVTKVAFCTPNAAFL